MKMLGSCGVSQASVGLEAQEELLPEKPKSATAILGLPPTPLSPSTSVKVSGHCGVLGFLNSATCKCMSGLHSAQTIAWDVARRMKSAQVHTGRAGGQAG